MYSYELMFAVHGNPAFADRAERIAYNALPATWASPKGGDMWAHISPHISHISPYLPISPPRWAHQYLQAINQINAVKADPHVWTHDGDQMAELEPQPQPPCSPSAVP